MGTHEKCLAEVFLMNTQNICFHPEEKYRYFLVGKRTLSRATLTNSPNIRYEEQMISSRISLAPWFWIIPFYKWSFMSKYRIQPSYSTVCLGFSKLLGKTYGKICIYLLKYALTLKAPRKPASVNVVCLCRLLNILVNFSNLFLHTGKQCGPRSDCSFTVCRSDF